MSHRGASFLESFHSVSSNQVILGAGAVVLLAVVLYLKFGRGDSRYGHEGFLSKLEHKAVKVGVTVGVMVVILGAAYLLGFI